MRVVCAAIGTTAIGKAIGKRQLGCDGDWEEAIGKGLLGSRHWDGVVGKQRMRLAIGGLANGEPRIG